MADPTVSINLAVTPQGAQQTAPLTLWQRFIALVAEINPGYSVLPAGLIEDLASTATYAIALMDSAACETINSLTPLGANPYVLTELGAQFGIPRGGPTRTSAYVRFSSPSIGYRIPIGFVVSDGTYTYTVQDGAVIGAGGTTGLVYCLATREGSWPVPANSIDVLASSIPNGYTLTVTNPQAGTPGGGEQTEAEYAALVLSAQQLNAQGTQAKAKTMLTNVPNVQPRLVSIVPFGNLWKIICGGGDPYAIAEAIYSSGIDISTLTGSTGDRTITVSIFDAPDTYQIPFVNPPAQVVSLQLSWATISPNFISESAFAQYGIPAVVNYINSIAVGQPINLIALNNVLTKAVVHLFNNDPALLSELSWTVSIDGQAAPPAGNSSLVYGDPESSMNATSANVIFTEI